MPILTVLEHDDVAKGDLRPATRASLLRLAKRWDPLFPLGVLGQVDRPHGLFPGMVWAGALEGNAPNPLPAPTIYTTAWCGDCTLLKGLFQSRDLLWETVDIDGNPEAVAVVEALSLGRRVIPTLDYGGFSLSNPPFRVFASLYG